MESRRNGPQLSSRHDDDGLDALFVKFHCEVDGNHIQGLPNK